MADKHKFWFGIWKFTYKDKNGKILWEEERQNDLVNEGENIMLDDFFRLQNGPLQFFARLCNDSLSKTDTLPMILGEPTGNGYIPQVIERTTVGWPVLELNAGDWRIISKEVTYTAAGGDIGPVNTAYLATTIDNTGKLIAFVPLSMSRTILEGDSLIMQISVKLI